MSRAACTGLFVAVSLLAAPGAFAAEERKAAELLPASTLFYAEIPRPDEVIDLITDHPVRARLEEADAYKRAVTSPEYVKLQLGVVLVEAQLGQGWRPALKAATAGGVAVAFDPATEGAAVLVRSGDAEVLGKFVKVFVDLARQDAKGKGKPDPIEEDAYREVNFYRLGEAAYAVHGGWLVVVNKDGLGKAILDRLLDGGGETLAGVERYQQAQEEVGEASAWAYVDMEGIRAASAKGPLASGRTENPVAELLVGGLIDNLRHTPYATAALTLATDRIAVAFEAPHDEAWVTEERRYFFGPEGAASPPAAEVDGTLLTLSTYRDVSQMWLRAGDLFDQNMADELAKADSGLTTLFGGRDFGEEILGSIGPELQLVVTRQDFAEVKPTPAVKLPAFALVGTLKDPETMRGELRRAFLSVIGFANVVGAMNGQPQLDFDLEKQSDGQTIVTRYLPEDDEADSTAARINFNFSPSIAFVGDRVVLSSTEGLARKLTEAADGEPVRGEAGRPNTLFEVDAAVLKETLADNREQLIAQNMLSEGHDRPEAERAIDGLIGLIGLFQDARLRLDAREGRVGVSVEATLKP